MYELDKLLYEIKQLEGKEDIFSVVIREELLEELELITSTGALAIVEDFVVGRSTVANYD